MTQLATERTVTAQRRLDPYGTAARLYRSMQDDGWDRDEAAEIIDWLLGKARTASGKVRQLEGYAKTNGLVIHGGQK